ncbi:PAS domain-containing protein [Burkholderia cenocepacia]|uniref:PAS domain-containing protein n=1 Tax=Burkholderia cenocepacia TaxID=95486 RepID=UPI002B24343F|nr:PAS domain-containing protein [Burkholderia cenocepacia]MEB2603427.1 PAS domain-containing protein [Burkholderia cenocepacia]
MTDGMLVTHPMGSAFDADDCPLSLLKLDGAGRIAGFNFAWTDAMERPAAGRRFVDYVHPEDRDIWNGMLQRSRTISRGGVRERLRCVRPDGELCWFEVSLKRKAEGSFVALSDVTLDRRRETSTQAHLRSVEGLLDSIPGLVYRGRNNRLWTMEYVSAGCEELTGYPRRWFLDGHTHAFGQLIVPEDADYVWTGVQQALAVRGVFDLRYRIRCADGRIKPVWETGVGIYTASGEVLGVEGAIFEVRTIDRPGV